MKTLITVLTLSIVTATPMLAQAASRHVQHSGQQLSNNVTFEGRNIGTDPDPNVRFDLNRNAGYYAGQD